MNQTVESVYVIYAFVTVDGDGPSCACIYGSREWCEALMYTRLQGKDDLLRTAVMSLYLDMTDEEFETTAAFCDGAVMLPVNTDHRVV